MASCCTASTAAKLTLLSLTIISSLHCFSVSSFEYQVGGNKGWLVPSANDTTIYNDWASENRFQVGDSVRFRYRKDSVMQVSEEDYKKCNSSHPSFFSNTGNTVYMLDHSGPFYFISGASGHCEKGQRMIIKVVSQEEGSHSSNADRGASAGSLAAVLFLSASNVICLLQVLLYAVSGVFY